MSDTEKTVIDIQIETECEDYVLETGTFDSSDCVSSTAYYVFLPKWWDAPRGVVQISHGMCEYLMRYEPFARELCRAGFVVCGNDHLGHGKTAGCEENLGFTVAGGGVRCMVRDMHTLYGIMRAKYPSLPYILFGHSMGSFLARLYAASYGRELSALILAGTAGPDTPASLGRTVAGAMMAIKGERYRSEKVRELAFKPYNKKFADEECDVSWITSDEAIREKYENDSLCGFNFTLRGYYDLFDMIVKISDKEWAKKIPSSLPILLMSGDADPVGNYGKGVRKVFRSLAGAGVADVTMRLYKNGRHELLSEVNRDVVIRNTLAWIDERLPE